MKMDWYLFLNKRINEDLGISRIFQEYIKLLSETAEKLIELESAKKELKRKWKKDPLILDKLKKEYKLEKALKILKQSIRK